MSSIDVLQPGCISDKNYDIAPCLQYFSPGSHSVNVGESRTIGEVFMDLTRRAGVLLHPTSLPGPNGIGELGSAAHSFVDWLVEAGQTIWQVMPLGPTGYGDSPYQCTSAFAGNPMMIDLEALVEEELLTSSDLKPLRKLPRDHVDFGGIIPAKETLLKRAFEVFKADGSDKRKDELAAFRMRYHHWIEDFALFTAIKRREGGSPWVDWPEPLRDRHPAAMEQARKQLESEIEYHCWRQFIFFEQWWRVRHHASEKGVVVMGDLPIFVAHDSADVWANRELFHLDGKGNPTLIAGVPPDYFSKTGQRWGNPLFAWDAHRANGYRWWENRFRVTFDVVDWVRIDHFRGFEAYWEIPAKEETAINGRWVQAPGSELFGTLLGRMGDLNVVAENLGVITEEVETLRKQFGFPGMRVLQFAWGSGPENSFLPHNYDLDSIVYTGTHDNNTSAGWAEEEMTEEALEQMTSYAGHDPSPVYRELIRMALSSVAAVAVIPMQDWLGLGAEGRMNTPGRPEGNWSWRAPEGVFSAELAAEMRELVNLYGRFEYGRRYGDEAAGE
jgi:4-alpha-glucanotransferase